MENIKIHILHFNCLTIIGVLLSVIIMTHAITMTWKFRKVADKKFTSIFAERESLSVISCVDFCLATGGCLIANYNQGTRTCALADSFQTYDAIMNWHALYISSGKTSCPSYFSFLRAIWTNAESYNIL